MDERFARHELIPGWRQDRLRRATVVIAGVGALGTEMARHLGLAGVGRLVLCDPDRIERSNLSRMALVRPEDVGRRKVTAVAERLNERIPDLEIDPRPLPLVQGVGLAELREASLAVSCLDSWASRLQLAGRCSLVRAPFLDGGTHPWGGEVRPFFDVDGPCYACSLSPHQRATTDVPWSCLDDRSTPEVGASAPIAGLVAAWMALLAVRLLMELSVPDTTLVIDGAGASLLRRTQKRDPECPLHRPIEGNISMLAIGRTDSVGALRAAAALGPQRSLLLWQPVQHRTECPECGFAEERWGLPAIEPCPSCGRDLRPRTTLELDGAPEDLALEDLGVASREVLAVRGPDTIDWVELRS